MFLMIQPFLRNCSFFIWLVKEKKIQAGRCLSIFASKLQPQGSSTVYPNLLYWFGVHIYFLWWKKNISAFIMVNHACECLEIFLKLKEV